MGQFIYFAIASLLIVETLQEGNVIVEQVKQSLALTAKTCMTTVGASMEDLEHLHKEPPYPEKTSCILSCLFEKINIIKEKKYSKKGFVTIVTPLVLQSPSKLEHFRNVSELCDKEIISMDQSYCALGNEIITCILKYAPELHFKQW